MSAPDIDDNILDTFSALTGESYLTILLGAGASIPTGLPDWNTFAMRLIMRSGLVQNEQAASILVNYQDQMIVLEAAKDRAGDKWKSHLIESLYGENKDLLLPSSLHFAAAGHYLALPESTTLSTLNYDIGLENALAISGVEEIDVDIEGATDFWGVTVHHLHGAIFGDSVHSPVVGFKDYSDLVSNEDAWQKKFLSKALAKGPLLLAGTSYRDPDIRHWLHLILQNEKPQHKAIVTFAREGFGLDSETFEDIRPALESEWKSIGLKALLAEDLSDISVIIRELQFLGVAEYLSPKNRCALLWEVHSRHFEAFQHSYQSQLEKTAKMIAKILEGEIHQGTLWLANGKGELARLASLSTQYLSEHYLKYVPTGHDSEWIAGEALAAENIKIKDVMRTGPSRPDWKSVLAIPLFLQYKNFPSIAAGVLSFGINEEAENLLRQQSSWDEKLQSIGDEWSALLTSRLNAQEVE